MDESNQIPTEDQPIASLLNPSFGIPYDVYFAFDDEEGVLCGAWWELTGTC